MKGISTSNSFINLVLLLSVSLGLSTARMDTLKPIVKVSPASGRPASLGGGDGDQFGFSAIAHQLFKDSAGLSFKEILDETLIISGAPNGVYPGGLDLPLDWRVCQEYRDTSGECANHTTDLMDYTDDQIMECYRSLRSGLVYTCPLSEGNCSPFISNGTVPGGYLYDSIGNYDPNCQSDLFNTFSKKEQRMGSFLFSSGDYFMACAPLLVRAFRILGSSSAEYPTGRCAISERNLQSFKPVLPCQDVGSRSIQGRQTFCLSGFSGDISGSSVSLGAPTHSAHGDTYYYHNISSLPDSLDLTLPLSPPAGTYDKFEGVNTTITDQNFGFTVISGYIYNTTVKSIIMSAPTSPLNIGGPPFGKVHVYESYEHFTQPAQIIRGHQFGEYFGYSIAAADLNGDSYDDLLVGAPLYSQFSPSVRTSLGRVYVYFNNGTHLMLNTNITGGVVGAQFGLSIASIGDHNNDGFEDIAVSAPFEGSGVVYIYYGQQLDKTGSIINTTYQQRINGLDVVSQVTNLTSLSSFGFSLSGSTDVDQNGYRDLIVGAHESQSVFVLRTVPVAIVNVTITFNTEQVMLQDYDCLYQGKPIACFKVTMCSEYTGKGIPSGFSTNYTFGEVVLSNHVSRLLFDNGLNNITRNITYISPNTLTCDNITVYVKNLTLSSDISDLRTRGEILSVPLDNTPVHTNSFPVDYSIIPDINTTPVDALLPIAVQCGYDRICDSDLKLTIKGVVFRKANVDELASDQSQVVIGDASFVDLFLSITNSEEDAFNTYLAFNLSNTLFSLAKSLNSSVSCTSVGGGIQYQCVGLKSPLRSSDVPQVVAIRLTVNSSLRGNENSVELSITAVIPEQDRNRENDTFTSDNTDIKTIDFGAVSYYSLTVFFSPNSYTYSGGNPASLNNISSNLGDRLSFRVSLRNSGPSPFRGYINVHIPAKGSGEDYYYFYPVKLSSGNLICSSSLNPDNYNIDNVQSSRLQQRRRRRRSTTIEDVASSFSLRQEEAMYNLDCQEKESGCMLVQCNVSQLGSNEVVSLEVVGFIDDRFFRGKTADYIIRGLVEADVNDGFTTTANSSRESTADMKFIRMVVPTGGGNEGEPFPYWYIIIPVILAILFIIILAIALYCLGFFKRRQKAKKKEQEEMDPYEDDYNPNDDETKDTKAAD